MFLKKFTRWTIFTNYLYQWATSHGFFKDCRMLLDVIWTEESCSNIQVVNTIPSPKLFYLNLRLRCSVTIRTGVLCSIHKCNAIQFWPPFSCQLFTSCKFHTQIPLCGFILHSLLSYFFLFCWCCISVWSCSCFNFPPSL